MNHDRSYKLLFSRPAMVADLLRGFVREDWVRDLDFDSLDRFNDGYVGGDLRERKDDIVWRLRFKGRWLYIYLLLEFQSGVNRFMAVRIMAYLGFLYQDIVRAERLGAGDRLPPALPVVLHNGKPRWTAPEDIAELIADAPGGLDRYRPRLRYLLLDEGRYAESNSHFGRQRAPKPFVVPPLGGLPRPRPPKACPERKPKGRNYERQNENCRYAESELAHLRNLAAALFRLENSRTPQDVERVLAALVEWLKMRSPDAA
jgi:hypothetical protein